MQANLHALSTTYTIDQLLDAFRELGDNLQRVRDKLKKPDTDGRHVALYGMQTAVVAYGLPLYAILGRGIKGAERTKEEVLASFSGYASIGGKSQDEILSVMETVWRLNLVAHIHFKLDSLFQNLLVALGATPGKSGFGQNRDALLSLVTLSDKAQTEQILNAFTFVRNSLHNNGIHRGAAWGPITVNGLTYDFKNNDGIQCASFGHVFALMDKVVDVLDEILHSHEITTLPQVIDRHVFLYP
jgi:hypothetical protein